MTATINLNSHPFPITNTNPIFSIPTTTTHLPTTISLWFQNHPPVALIGQGVADVGNVGHVLLHPLDLLGVVLHPLVLEVPRVAQLAHARIKVCLLLLLLGVSQTDLELVEEGFVYVVQAVCEYICTDKLVECHDLEQEKTVDC